MMELLVVPRRYSTPIVDPLGRGPVRTNRKGEDSWGFAEEGPLERGFSDVSNPTEFSRWVFGHAATQRRLW